MHFPDEFKKFTEDHVEFERSDLLLMIWRMKEWYASLKRAHTATTIGSVALRQECIILREMLYEACASKCQYDYTKAEVDNFIQNRLKYTKAEVDAMVQEEFNGTSKYPGVPNESPTSDVQDSARGH